MTEDQRDQGAAYFTTPITLESMRKLLGLSHAECGLLLGGANQEEVRILERPKTNFIYAEHEALLLDMMDRMNKCIEDAMKQVPALPFLVTYRDDGHLAEFDPELATWMRFATVHRMFIGRLWWELTLDGIDTTIVALNVASYMDFMKLDNRDDSRDARREWASQYAATYYTQRTGPVTKTQDDAEQAIERRASWSKDGMERPRRRRERLKGATTVI